MHFCHQCNYNTTKKSNYNRHLETKKHIRNINKERIKKSTIKCPYCDKTFTRKDSLIRHMNQRCKITKKIANIQPITSKNLVYHQTIAPSLPIINNDTEDKWTCPKCSFTFKHHSSYYRHKKKNTCSNFNKQEIIQSIKDIQPNYENDLRNILIKLKNNTKLENIIFIVFDVYNK